MNKIAQLLAAAPQHVTSGAIPPLRSVREFCQGEPSVLDLRGTVSVQLGQ